MSANKVEHKFNTADTEINNKEKRTDSNYLCDSFDVFNNEHCQLKQCKSLSRISNTLTIYHSTTNTKSIYRFSRYSNVDLLNDFNHLLIKHSNNFENIYNKLVKQTNNDKICDLTNCSLIRRNQRNRSVENDKLYFDGNNDKKVIFQQSLDRIHSYYFHSYDCYKITKKERENIINDSQNDSDYINDKVSIDSNVRSIKNLVKAKRSNLSKLSELNRFNASNNRLSMNTEAKQDEKQDEKQNEKEYLYSYGIRYFYWSFYQYNESRKDEAHWLSGTTHGVPQDANANYKLKDWYITAKYKDFKKEMLFNKISVVSLSEWNNLLQKANDHMVTNKVRKIKCPRTTSAKCYDMKPGQKITSNHLISMMIYCNQNTLQRKLTETYRYKNKNESDDELKERHRNFYFLGRFLRECVECFGTEWTSSNQDGNINLYHGINQNFTFSSLNAFIAGAFSATTDFAVSVSFAGNGGMVLNLNMVAKHWRYKLTEGIDAMFRIPCWDCQWLTDFVNESEIFFIGGLNKLTIETIMDVSSSLNYKSYITGLKHMTYCMTNGDVNPDDENMPSSTQEMQMVYRLLAHELHLYDSKNANAHEFKTCPQYILKILHSHCENIKHIYFNNINVEENRVHELLFKRNDGWIRLDLLTNLFPNIELIQYSVIDLKDVLLSKQSFIYDSIIEFIKINTTTTLKQINMQIELETLQELETLKSCVEFNEHSFTQNAWNICVYVEEPYDKSDDQYTMDPYDDEDGDEDEDDQYTMDPYDEEAMNEINEMGKMAKMHAKTLDSMGKVSIKICKAQK